MFSIGIFAFNDVEVLDFAGPYEVFTTASRVHALQTTTQTPLFQVHCITQTIEPIKARAGLVILPDTMTSQTPPLDLLIIPGGVVTKEFNNQSTIEWIKKMSTTVPIVASVCTGAFLLAQAGLLHNKQVTTHWEDCRELQTMFPQLIVDGSQRWIDHGHIVTSAGISAGIDMSLHLVERLVHRELAVQTARQMQYDNANF